MLTEHQRHIEELFNGWIINIPQELIDALPSMGRRRDGQEIGALIWHRIRMGEMRVRKNLKDRGVGVCQEEFLKIACSNSIVKWKRKLVKAGFIKVVKEGRWYGDGNLKNTADVLKTLRRGNRTRYGLEFKSSNDALSRYLQYNSPPCTYTRELLDQIEVDVEGVKGNFGEQLVSYLNDSEMPLNEMSRRQLIAFQNDETKRIPEDHDLDGLTCPLRELIHHRGKIHRGSKGNRLFSGFTQLKKTFRPYLTLFGEPLVGIDATACQPSLLAWMAGDNDLLNACLNDTFYDELADAMGKSVDVTVTDFYFDRKRAKRVFYEYCFGGVRKPNTKSQDALKVQDYIQKRYPKTHQFVWQKKYKRDYRKFSQELQRTESSIFIDQVLVKAKEQDIPVLTIHDCAVTIQSYQTELLHLLKQVTSNKNAIFDRRFFDNNPRVLFNFKTENFNSSSLLFSRHSRTSSQSSDENQNFKSLA